VQKQIHSKVVRIAVRQPIHRLQSPDRIGIDGSTAGARAKDRMDILVDSIVARPIVPARS
jgi:hypothetical protein